MPTTKKARGSPGHSQVRNASKSRPGRQANSEYPQQQCNTSDVNPVPVCRLAFTCELVRANQCVEHEYLPVEDSALRTLITRTAAEELRGAKDLVANDGSSVMSTKSVNLNAVVGVLGAEGDSLEDAFILRAVSFGQLMKKYNFVPDLSMREEPKTVHDYVPAEEFETYNSPEPAKLGAAPVTKLYCQAPAALGGWHAEVVHVHKQRFRVVLEFEVKVAGEYIAARISCNPRTKEHVYNDATRHKEQCVKLQTGSFDVNDKFSPGDALADAIFVKSTNPLLFMPASWQGVDDEGGEEAIEEPGLQV